MQGKKKQENKTKERKRGTLVSSFRLQNIQEKERESESEIFLSRFSYL